jgi:hypothetical protein
MKVYKYKNYNHYVESQKKANVKKGYKTWAVRDNIKFIAEYIKSVIPEVKTGLCHGARRGLEQDWFMESLPGSIVTGTEIGEVKSPVTVQWDFNKQNPLWIKKFDFVYSNSFDHAFSPEETIKIWHEQVKPGGLIILEYDKRQEHTGEISKPVNPMDPVSLTVDECAEMMTRLFPESVVSVIDLPVVKKVFQKAVILQVR